MSGLRSALAALIRWSGLAWLVRNTYGRRKVAVILYHDPDPESLERQLEFLGSRYSLIELNRLVTALVSGDWSGIPPRSLVVTIDDGHAGNFVLLDVLRRHAVRPTIFLCSQIVRTSRHFWFEHVSPEEAEELKFLDDDERLARLARDRDFTQEHEYEGDRQALDGAQLEALSEHCAFEAHTRFHPLLTHCDLEVARREIADARPEVEQISGAPCRHFAYPNGAFTEREARLAREAGYHSARGVDIGWNHKRTDPFALRILSVADGASNTALAAELTGLKWLSRLLRREGDLRGRFRPRWERRDV